MAKQNLAVFAKDGLIANAIVNTANTNRDGSTGTYTLLYSATGDGARITYIRAKAIVTTTAGAIRIFIKPNGGTLRQFGVIPIPAVTVSATVDGAEGEFYFTEPLIMNSGDEIRVTNEKSEAINVFALGSAY